MNLIHPCSEILCTVQPLETGFGVRLSLNLALPLTACMILITLFNVALPKFPSLDLSCFKVSKIAS